MFKRIITLFVVALMVFAFASCKPSTEDGKSEFKLGVILLHDDSSTYDLNFIKAVDEAAEALGLSQSQVIIKKNIPESNECYVAARDLVAEGCKVIFADSFGHEDFLIKAAKDFPEVQFCHATGTKAHTENLPNYHNAFASIYEGRYLAGIAAGLKLKAMMEADGAVIPKIGYIGAFKYAEVISGFTSFYLGVKEIVPEVTMDVQFTNSWYDETAEKNAALALINDGCVLISQHADSMGAPSACEERKIPNVSYNVSNKTDCPNTFIVASRIDWAPYVKYICECVMNDEAIAVDLTGTFATGSVKLTEINENAAAANTQAVIDEYAAKLAAGEVHVFDTKNFTVNGEELTSYMADVDSDEAFSPDTEAIADGYFHESEYRSAPYFDVKIDGIVWKN